MTDEERIAELERQLAEARAGKWVPDRCKRCNSLADDNTCSNGMPMRESCEFYGDGPLPGPEEVRGILGDVGEEEDEPDYCAQVQTEVHLAESCLSNNQAMVYAVCAHALALAAVAQAIWRIGDAIAWRPPEVHP